MPFWQRILDAWGTFFFGNPARTMKILAFGFGLYLLNNPAILIRGVNHLANEVVGPLFPILLTLFIIWWMVGVMRKKVTPAKKKGK